MGLALVLAGCGDDGAMTGDAATPGGEDRPTETAGDGGSGTGGGDDCRFVSTEAVQAVFGDEAELNRGGDSCNFGVGEMSIDLTYIRVQIDPGEYADDALEASCEEDTAVEVESGDRAYACISFLGPLANVYRGSDLVVVNTSSVEDEDAEDVRDSLAELLPEIDPSA